MQVIAEEIQPSRIEPEQGLEHYTPDEVAETLGGISSSTYVRLWNILLELKKSDQAAPMGGDVHDPENGVVEDPFSRRDIVGEGKGNMISIWDRLTPEEQSEINEAFRNRGASVKISESENKRTMDKGLGVDGEAVKEDLTNAGKSYTGFGDGKGDAKDKGLGVEGEKGGEEATSEYKSESVNFDKNDAENEDAVEGFGGGPESPSSEVKDPSERPDESIEETDISYHNGPVLEKEIRGPSAGGPGKKHELKEDTFKWTKVEDRLIVSTMESCGSDCKNCSCGDSCGKDCPCKKKV